MASNGNASPRIGELPLVSRRRGGLGKARGDFEVEMPLPVRRRRELPFHSLLPRRMVDREKIRVEREPGIVEDLARTVTKVTDDRVSRRRELEPDLMGPAGVELDIEKTATVSPPETIPAESCLESSRRGRSDRSDPLAGLQNPIDARRGIRGVALDDGEVTLRDGTLSELLGEPRGSLRRAREHDETRDRTIEPMDETEKDFTGLRELAPQEVLPQREEIGIARAIRLRENAGVFRDDEQMVVEVDDAHNT
jgi:hypothetical protein